MVIILPLSSRGRGPLPFTEETGIRIPPGVFFYQVQLRRHVIEPEYCITVVDYFLRKLKKS